MTRKITSADGKCIYTDLPIELTRGSAIDVAPYLTVWFGECTLGFYPKEDGLTPGLRLDFMNLPVTVETL